MKHKRGNTTESTLRRMIAGKAGKIKGSKLSVRQREGLILGQKTLECRRLPSGIGCREIITRMRGRLPK